MQEAPYLFIFTFDCTRSSLLCVGFSLAASNRLLFVVVVGLLMAAASRCVVPRLRSAGSAVVGTQAQLLRGLWDLPGPGIDAVSPALAVGFLSTGPAGKWDRGLRTSNSASRLLSTCYISTCVSLHDVPLEGCACPLVLKLQYSGHLMRGASSLGKTLILGKIEGRRGRRWQRMRWLDASTDSMDMNSSKLQEMVKDRGAWRAGVCGVTESDTT